MRVDSSVRSISMERGKKRGIEGAQMVTRREFLDTLAVGAAGLAVTSTAKSYGQILGSNERLNFAVIGLNSRAYAHLSSLKANKDSARITHVCDVASTIQAQKKFGKLCQMGTQQRSSAFTIDIIEKIHNGLVGRPYFAKCWYNATRKSIGGGKVAPVPATLDWDLWQGPAPRQAYKDNVHPYNWHWFRTWGTGETLNNGTHEVDVCRWALAVDYPNRVTASGGRYHFKDDWQFYDTLITSYEYGDKMISWEGMCCQGMKYYTRGRGSLIEGTEGTVMIDRDGYEIYDLKGNKTSEFKVGKVTSTAD